VSALNYEITGLSASTSYDVYVRQDCTANQSDWVKVTFTTLPLACPVGDVTLASQTQVNNFLINYPNCTEIQGNLHIQGNNITNLSALGNITGITGHLTISG